MKLVVRFLGIYDTVGSVGLGGDKDNQWFLATSDLPGSPDTATLDIAEHAACSVYHLGALDECRANFPISSIKVDKDAPLPQHFEEEYVLGAHADVGGGYSDNSTTIHYPIQKLNYSRLFADSKQYQADKSRLKSELEKRYFRPGIDIQFEESSWGNKTIADTALKPYWQRSVSKELAFIYLEKMHQKALNFGVPLKPLESLGDASNAGRYDYQISDELRSLHPNASESGKGSEAYNQLYKDYIHHSHQHGGGFSEAIPNAPEDDPAFTFGNYQREVYYGENTGLSASDQWEFNTNNNGIVQWYKN